MKACTVPLVPWLLAAASLLAATGLQAAATPEQLARLGSELTPVGAERAGNADGSIPPWSGGLPRKAIDPALGYEDPYAQDPILFTIDAANAAQHAERLSPGQLALLKAHPQTFRMNVYPTRRSAALPDAVLAEVKKQAPLARTDGDQLLDVGKSAVPFPIPADGLQVMWNHVLRWRGGAYSRMYTWFPVADSGRYFTVRLLEHTAFDQQGYIKEPRPNRLANTLGFYLAPAGIEGQMTLVWEPVNPVETSRAAWIYDTRWTRVTRVPALCCDHIDPRTQGLRTADQFDGWNGTPERYDWKLVGKREMYIQYNAYKLSDRKLKYADIVKPKHPDPALLRYERHRVWVVEATLKPGAHHRYVKRTFYVDEDTWQVAMEEAYNARGELWRFGDHATMQYYDVMVPWYRATTHYDLLAGAYLISHLDNEETYVRTWGKVAEMNEFLPSTLRLYGTR